MFYALNPNFHLLINYSAFTNCRVITYFDSLCIIFILFYNNKDLSS